MSINFEALDLRAFVAVVDLEGFHRAAEALNLSQPALSRRIQKLEAAVGAALLERTTRRVALTTVGLESCRLSDGCSTSSTCRCSRCGMSADNGGV